MSNSILLYGQLMGYLRQHSRYRNLRHLKALGWMVSALVCSGQLQPSRVGTLRACSRPKSPKHRTTLAEIYEQRTDSSRSAVSAFGYGRLTRMAIPSALLSIGHHHVAGARSV